MSEANRCPKCDVNLVEAFGVHASDCDLRSTTATPAPKDIKPKAKPKGSSQLTIWGEIYFVSSKYVVLHVMASRKRFPELNAGRLVFDRKTWQEGVAETLGFEIKDPKNVLRHLDEEPEHAPVFSKNEPTYPEHVPAKG